LGLVLPTNPGQTRLDDDERDGLLIPTITTRQELDEFEQLNVEDAIQWTLEASILAEEILTESFVKTLHERMFGNCWAWAGQFRNTNKNLGVDKFEIPHNLRTLLEDARFWMGNSTFGPDELCVRFKHRLVLIHCFPNGNGRHARLMADVLVSRGFGLDVFSWGSATLSQAGTARQSYIATLRTADEGNLAPLVKFARS
jgi:Fic-DOC domain mobile mystery protein B